jgi:hypothetical protein
MTLERVNVVVEAADGDEFEAVVARCRKAGLRVDQALPAIGVISGRINAAGRRRLGRVKGVTAVESDRAISIPPPDNEVQ